MSFAECRFGGCDAPAGRDETVCFDHYVDLKAGALNGCPGCKRLKPRTSPHCRDCAAETSGRTQGDRTQATGALRQRLIARVTGPPDEHSRIRERRGRYEPESSYAWDRGDENATVYYTYILKMDGAEFYYGHTRDLRARLSEHRDGSSPSTAGRQLRLVWFTETPTRAEAASLEAALKELNDRNPREIRKMVIRFQDLVREMSETE